MFVSLDTEVSQSDYDNVMLSSHVISESRVKVSPVKFTNISAEMNSVGGWTSYPSTRSINVKYCVALTGSLPPNIVAPVPDVRPF